ncbi:MAG: OmpA family protein [Paludibacteraceae bacterium]|nr:OmpA family protein [Paludibacteraceae bacterium]
MKKTIIAIILIASSVQLMAREYPDSVLEASQAQARINKGLSIELSGGVGMSRIDFQHWGQKGNEAFQNNNLGQKISFPSGNAALGLTYYFIPSFGIGTGLEFTNYTSKTAFKSPLQFEATDKYGDNYIQTIRTDATERQDLYMLEIPVGLHFRALGEGKKVGFIGALGVKFGLPMKSTYQMKDAYTIYNNIYYPIYDLAIEQIPTVIEHGTAQPYSGSFGTLVSGDKRYNMAKFNYAGYAQLGVLFQLSQHVDMSLSAFATYYINDVLDNHGYEPVSFGGALPEGEYPTRLSNNRTEMGFVNTNAVSSLHPWNVGLKVGFHFNTDKTDAKKEYDKQEREKERLARKSAREERLRNDSIVTDSLKPDPNYPDTLSYFEDKLTEDTISEQPERECECIDTIYIYVHDTIYVHDSVITTIENPAEQISDIMAKSIIWFALDSDVPILQPEDILINMAAILKAHPQQRVYVTGHACKLGKPDYNMDLAMRRAKAVAKQLKALGVKDEQMIIQTRGANVPYRFNGKHTLEKDRRVEIIPVEMVDEVAESVQQQGEQVVLKAGDRLAKLARKYYGNTEDWILIYNANKDVITNPDVLPVGKTIIIPTK